MSSSKAIDPELRNSNAARHDLQISPVNVGDPIGGIFETGGHVGHGHGVSAGWRLSGCGLRRGGSCHPAG